MSSLMMLRQPKTFADDESPRAEALVVAAAYCVNRTVSAGAIAKCCGVSRVRALLREARGRSLR